MGYLTLKQNPYFSILVKKHSKEFDITNAEFNNKFKEYLCEYTEAHWGVITDYLTERTSDKIESFNKSFEDFRFASSYINTFFLGFLDEEYQVFSKRLESYLNVPKTEYSSSKDYFLNISGQKIIKRDVFDILENDVKLTKDASRILFLANYSEWFVNQFKEAIVHHATE